MCVIENQHLLRLLLRQYKNIDLLDVIIRKEREQIL